MKKNTLTIGVKQMKERWSKIQRMNFYDEPLRGFMIENLSFIYLISFYNLGCEDGGGGGGQGKRVFLKCTHCKEVFPGAWDLMFHVQNAHSLNIYSLGENNKKV